MSTTRRQTQGSGQKVFVTVGTTQFDKLIQTVCHTHTLKCLEKLGYKHVLLQTGAGQFQPDNTLTTVQGVTIDHYNYKPSILEDIQAADLVISHAGAGSCLETLGAGKKLLVVINDDLMDNHQLELAYQLSSDKHLYYCTCSSLVTTLETEDFDQLQPYPSGQPEKFAQYLDTMMGYS